MVRDRSGSEGAKTPAQLKIDRCLQQRTQVERSSGVHDCGQPRIDGVDLAGIDDTRLLGPRVDRHEEEHEGVGS